MAFTYEQAFVRNLGWITKDEQALLRTKTVAIAGLGGVGGRHALTLARLGVGGFHIADFDRFELQNINRQAGANLHTIGLPKVDVVRDQLLSINPELRIKAFPHGVTEQNTTSFLSGVDLYVDGLDAFVIDLRRQVFAECFRLGISAVTVAPIGMGAALINFTPDAMTFEDYFGFQEHTELEKKARFICGITPSFVHVPAMVDLSYFDLEANRAGSLPMGCDLAAGVLGTEALKILLQRGKIARAPHGLHFDAYSYRLRKTWMPLGRRNPLFLLKVQAVMRLMGRPNLRK